MILWSNIKNSFLSTKRKLQTNSFENLLWLVNVVPTIAGFSTNVESVWVPFWIVHCSLLCYVYVAGLFVFQWKHAESVEDFIKSYFSLSVLILVLNISLWWIIKRQLLRAILKDMDLCDRLSRRSSIIEVKHERLMRTIKFIILIYYGTNMCNAFTVYWPNRVDLRSKYYMTPCVGIEPLTTSPKREICIIMLLVQEISISMVALNFEALLVLLIAHTSSMYTLLSQEIMMLNENEANAKTLAKELLPSLISRHSLILEIVNKLKFLYSVPIGVNFGTNAVCICLFFYLPLQELIKFMPILMYCSLGFFLYCFLGQRLVNASEEFETSVYSCGWENFELKEKKMIYVMLRQAQKPIQLLAADIIPVNISTFATTLQGVFKFVTVVKV